VFLSGAGKSVHRADLTPLDQPQDGFAGRTFEQANIVSPRDRLDAHQNPLAITFPALRRRLHDEISIARRRPRPYGSRGREGLIFRAVGSRTGRPGFGIFKSARRLPERDHPMTGDEVAGYAFG
jgi:hypothetical protein